MKKLHSQILYQLSTPKTFSELVEALGIEYGIKKALEKMVSEGLIEVRDFKYKKI
jgi:hypothetical protein